jgi:subtilase family serine protease
MQRIVPVLLSLVVGSVSLFMGGAIVVANNNNSDNNANPENNGNHYGEIRVCDLPKPGTVECHAHVLTDANGNPKASPSTFAGYTPAQFSKAYELPTVAPGHPIIAVVEGGDDPTIVNDLAVFSTKMGLPQLPVCVGTIASSAVPCLQKVNQRGATSPLPPTNASWGTETALDVETIHGLCNNCSILIVESDTTNDYDMFPADSKAVELGANVVSNSFGAWEYAGETAFDVYLNHPGVAMVASSGDSDYGYPREYPAVSPYVTAVGGTSLYLNADNSYNYEKAYVLASSGCSTYETNKPTWQTDPLCAKRTAVDATADGDPHTGAAIYTTTAKKSNSTGWLTVAGTSLAAPIIAATYALSGNIPAATQEASLPYLPGSAAFLHDITQGWNGACNKTYLCTAGPGYDGPSGMGSPKGVGAF